MSSARYFADIDIFHDRAERIAAQAEADAALLSKAGFDVTWLRQAAFIHSAIIAKGGEQTKLEWVGDSDFRLFPAIRDPLFGYRLHPLDLAINKLFAAATDRMPAIVPPQALQTWLSGVPDAAKTVLQTFDDQGGWDMQPQHKKSAQGDLCG